MTPHCDKIQEQLAAECAAERPWNSSVEEHLRECEVCAQSAEGMLRSLKALRELGRVTAENDLEGRVVAACQAGYREARAIDSLCSLTTEKVPAELDERIDVLISSLGTEGELSQKTPAELDERVEDSLQDLPQTISRSFVQKVDRLAAPGELEGRLDKDLLNAGERLGSRGWATSQRTLLTGLALAAGLLLIISVVPTFTTGDSEETAELLSSLSFEVERPGTFQGMNVESLKIGSALIPAFDAILHGAKPWQSEEFQSAAAPAGGPQSSGTNARLGIKNTTTGHGAPATSRRPLSGGNYAASGGTSGGSAQTGQTTSGRFGPGYLNDSLDALTTVKFRGERRTLSRIESGSVVTEYDYREEVASDGAGNFAIVPLAIISPPMNLADESSFLQAQERRESFFFRHRGFRIRHLSSFWRNYEAADLGLSQVVAGRSCERFEIKRIDGTGDRFSISIDPATSLVLYEERRTQAGVLIGKTWYETFELSPDLSNIQLTGGPSEWIEFDPSQAPSVFTKALRVPSAPPSGYELRSSGYFASAGPSGLAWAQFIYGDGNEEVFFLCEDGSHPGGSSNGQTSAGGASGQNSNLVRLYELGQLTLIEGLVNGRFVVAIGRVHEQELLLMLQSAFE
ncbi:MAG: hypothetical protein ACI8X5_001237 [Planctomycetota bacterium]|jgi:hypothetical protein